MTTTTTTAPQQAIASLSAEERRQRRKAQNKTQADIAAEVSVSLTTVAKWEQAIATPSPERATKYAAALGLEAAR